MAYRHAIEPTVVIISQYGSRARHAGTLANDADFEDTRNGQFPRTPQRVLTIRGESLTGDGASILRISDSLREFLEQADAAPHVWFGSIRGGIQNRHDVSACRVGEKAQAEAAKEALYLLSAGTP
jgi:hypothetical protein